jgi:hypothetical protein
MGRRLRGVIFFTLPALLLWSSLALAAGVQALFDLEIPTGGPFPSDRFTVADVGQETGLRVNLPKPNCAARPSDCTDLDVINARRLQPLAKAVDPLRRPIDPSSVSSQTVMLIGLGDPRLGDTKGGKVVGIN